MLLSTITGPESPAFREGFEGFYRELSPQLHELGMPTTAWIETSQQELCGKHL